ncbi:cell wall protein PhiA [Xylariomycetidae sp. FL2044]|nr:cell wall protein PhiA [Xylariomycetidae sp. FL2044]
MSLKLAVVSALAGLSAALPRNSTQIPADAKFNLMTIRSGSDVQYAGVTAAISSLLVNYPDQDASCDTNADVSTATFYLNDGGLYLYAASATPQQLFSDRSGMGQGIVQYTTGAQSAPKNAERGPFVLDSSNDLTLDGAGFIACPNENGSSSIWIDTGAETPGGREGCLGVVMRAVEAPNPVSCVYTQY